MTNDDRTRLVILEWKQTQRDTDETLKLPKMVFWWIEKYVLSLKLVVYSYMIHWFTDLHVKSYIYSFNAGQYSQKCHRAENIWPLMFFFKKQQDGNCFHPKLTASKQHGKSKNLTIRSKRFDVKECATCGVY